jgi:hypothetical protein
MNVIEEIVAERRRQIEAEGWTHEHDDTHTRGELAKAAAGYALHSSKAWLLHSYTHIAHIPTFWPWDDGWWRPRNSRRDLIRAAALIVAEIERLDRAAQENRP